jgi:phospholipase/carboxylesterase
MPADALALRITHQAPEPRDPAPPTGHVHVERGDSRAVLLTPTEIEPDRLYPLVTVLHGAGRQDEMLVKAVRDEPDRRGAFFLVPRSLLPTWDLIASPKRPDLDFLEYAYDLIWRRYPIDPARQALLGYSDGASFALSVGLSNPTLFRAVMAWAAGFIALAPGFDVDAARKPEVLLEYGTHDPVFPFQQIALPMRANLERAGYTVEWRVDQGGKHWPSPDFLREALDWFFALR